LKGCAWGEEEKLPQVSSEGERDPFHPKAQSAPFPWGTVALSGWHCSVLTYGLASVSAGFGGGGSGKAHSSPLPFSFFLKPTIIFDYSFLFVRNTESFLGWKEELDTFLSILGGK